MSGVAFPGTSTASTGRQVWADAVRGVDAELAAGIAAEKDWRKSYLTRVVDVTAATTRTAAGAVTVARDGLAALAATMVFDVDGVRTPVPDAVKEQPGQPIGRRIVAGEGKPDTELVVPYRGGELRGGGLLNQLGRWAEARLVEQSFADALTAVVEHPEWLDLTDLAFGVLGAGAELGPTLPLLTWGAHVAGVDLPDARLWERLEAHARGSAGTLEIPLQPDGAPGADLLTQTPAIAGWLAGAAEARPMTVGSYAYADGAKHVLVAVASDAIVDHLLNTRPGTAYSELATPTDAYAVPIEVVEESRRRWGSRGWLASVQAPARMLSRGSLYAPAYDVVLTRDDGGVVGIADVLVPQQGPNYTLAKRLQRWRAITAQAGGHRVSANVAPATSTRSVTKNRLLAAAYAGASAFGVEIFRPETARVLMAALLVHDLRTAQLPPDHPDDLFSGQAAHGGLWTVGYSPRSVLGLAAIRGLPSTLRP